MPNHFHLLIKQNGSNSIDQFMNSSNTRYVMYFNKKYNRVGPLFQGVYKAVSIETDEQLLYLSAYIHRNPLELSNVPKLILQGEALQNQLGRQPSSLPEYLGKRKTDWVKSQEILEYFSQRNENLMYGKFILGNSVPDESIIRLTFDE